MFDDNFCNFCKKPKCGECKCKHKSPCSDPCGAPLRVLSIKPVPNKPGFLRFNLDGSSQEFDFRDVVAQTETNTQLRLDSVNRLLRYYAEDGVHNITASQLGGILHLGDLGDVDVTGAKNSSLLFYERTSECGTGCDNRTNMWKAFDSTKRYATSLTSLLGFDDDGSPVSLAPPTSSSANQFYSLSWSADNKLSYTQPVEVSVPSVGTDGFSQLLFVNPQTRQLESLRVKVAIDNEGNVTFKTRGEED